MVRGISVLRSYFYPRPPRGGRPVDEARFNALVQFLSTPSARRATASASQRHRKRRFLSTPSARRATCRPKGYRTDADYFYPRPPRGGRPRTSRHCSATAYFYPRPPRGGRRSARPCTGRMCRISIHALREEGDTSTLWSSSCSRYFYPRPPRGGRLSSQCRFLRQSAYFYPRPPRGGRPSGWRS